MTSLETCKTLALALISAVFLLLGGSGRLYAEIPEESEACLGCHGQHGLTFTFQNKEKMDAFVDRDRFRASVHASIPCSSCHADFSKSNHPQRSFRSRQQYSMKSSLVCRLCHPEEQIKKSPIHASLLENSETSPVCSSCHAPHSIMPLADSRKFSTEKQYCLGCHKQSLSLKLKNGGRISLKVDAAVLDKFGTQQTRLRGLPFRLFRQPASQEELRGRAQFFHHPFRCLQALPFRQIYQDAREHPFYHAEPGEPGSPGLHGLPWHAWDRTDSGRQIGRRPAMRQLPPGHVCNLCIQRPRKRAAERKKYRRAGLHRLPLRPYHRRCPLRGLPRQGSRHLRQMPRQQGGHETIRLEHRASSTPICRTFTALH